MSSRVNIRQRQVPWARRALGLFVLAWLNMALQPCAMAMGGDDQDDCPHCPTSHAEQQDGLDMIAHGEAEPVMPCASGADDCKLLNTVNVDSRTGPHKPKNMPSDLPIAIFPSAAFPANVDYRGLHDLPPITYRPSDNTRPLNVLYCVYLK